MGIGTQRYVADVQTTASQASKSPVAAPFPERREKRGNKTRRPLHQESSAPCIRRGKCRLCEVRLGDFPMGRARCRGCSVVDTMELTKHPFHSIVLRDAQDGWPKALPPNKERAASLPPQGDSELHVSAVNLPPANDVEAERIAELFSALDQSRVDVMNDDDYVTYDSE